jgi:hypothetical protein
MSPDKSDNRTSSGLVLHLSGKRVNQELKRPNTGQCRESEPFFDVVTVGAA